MKRNLVILYISTITLAIFGSSLVGCNKNIFDNDLDIIGKSTAEILRHRGFKAENHYVTTEDNYIVNIVKATNPLINQGLSGHKNKSVVLFIHGSTLNARGFFLNSGGAKPKDYGGYNAGSMSNETLIELLKDDPSINSLPLLLLNFGHEVWLLNKRGCSESLGRVGGKNATIEQIPNVNELIGEIFVKMVWDKAFQNSTDTFTNLLEALATITQKFTTKLNSDYWNYSLDEQAKLEFPAVIDYVRKETDRKKISVVGHSAGGAIILMGLAESPQIALKLERAILWSPAVNLGWSVQERMKIPVTKIFTNYIGPFPPLFFLPIMKSIIAGLCSTVATRETLCRLVLNLLFGIDGFSQRLNVGQVMEGLDTCSGHELAHYAQTLDHGGHTHYFDYGTKSQNFELYGAEEPPAYDFSRIILKDMTLFTGTTDGLVSSKTLEKIHKALIVGDEHIIVEGKDGRFNHGGFLLNDNVGVLVNIPSLKRLETRAHE